MCVAFAIGWASATTVHAHRPFELAWTAPVGCPGQESVAAQIERLLGAEVAPRVPLIVRATMVRIGAELELAIETSEAGARRVIRGARCETLAEAGALVIAMAIDPEAVARTERAESGGVEAPATLEVDPVASEPLPSREPPPRRGTARLRRSDDPRARPPLPAARGPGDTARFIGAIGGGIAVGPLPAIAPVVAVSAGLRFGVLELTLGGAYLAEQGTRLPGSTTRGGSFGLATGRVRSCFLFALDRLVEIGPCAIASVGGTWGRGEGVPRVQRALSPWFSLSAALDARLWLLDWLGIALAAELEVPVTRPVFELEIEGAATAVHRATAIAGQFAIAAVVRLP